MEWFVQSHLRGKFALAYSHNSQLWGFYKIAMLGFGASEQAVVSCLKTQFPHLIPNLTDGVLLKRFLCLNFGLNKLKQIPHRSWFIPFYIVVLAVTFRCSIKSWELFRVRPSWREFRSQKLSIFRRMPLYGAAGPGQRSRSAKSRLYF